MKVETRHAFVFPSPVAVVTAAAPGGGSNLITLAWVGMACSEPVHVTVAVRPTRHTHGLIVASGEFCLNLLSEEMVRSVDVCGVRSGRDTDKWEAAGLTPEPAEDVGAPRIAEAAYVLECAVVERLSLGVHDLFVARVLGAYAEESVLADGKVDYDALRPLSYCPTEYRSLGARVYGYGESVKG
ncbi:MAG: flavin reductase family protein [Coriobacteriia bacterium]|nr:flavin reductase family protein [Coriobacteriia bacterium]